MNTQHPTITSYLAKNTSTLKPQSLDRDTLIAIAKECGAADAGVVGLDRPELDPDRSYIVKAYAATKSLLCIAVRMSPEPIRSTARSLANNEFHASTHDVNQVARNIVSRLRDMGVASMNTSAGFPMEMSEFPGRSWIVSHKVVAEAAGLGRMGIHRNVIHPIFGNFILLNTILIDGDVTSQSEPIDYNPCLGCKLCVAACPVGAIGSDGHFDGVSCLNHNYREFMGGFIDWVQVVADSPNRHAYREKVTDQETASVWQSLSFGANYKSAYCMAVCPAGEDVIGAFLKDKAGFVKSVLNPLQEKEEAVYVVANSDAEAHVNRRFPNKTVRRIHSGVAPLTVKGLLRLMPLAFQRGQSKGIDATYHFKFTGREGLEATVRIAEQKIQIEPGFQGRAGLKVTVDSRAWLEFLARKRTIPSLILSGALKLKGNPKLLLDFGRCFPA